MRVGLVEGLLVDWLDHSTVRKAPQGQERRLVSTEQRLTTEGQCMVRIGLATAVSSDHRVAVRDAAGSYIKVTVGS